ncbi:MAG: hypothetical protein WBB19_00860 [Desulforhopalus sp.]
MRILIAGLPKTGTTGLLYLVTNSLSKKPKILFEPKEYVAGLDESDGVIAKILISSKDLNKQSFSGFEKKITILRDPRDRMVSALLYSQFREIYLQDDNSVNIVKTCLERKERDPRSVSIRELLATIKSVNDKKSATLSFESKIRKSLSSFDDYIATMPESLLYKYEDFVSGDFSPLEEYLGFAVRGKAEVPARLRRVERTKGYGDWRNWFTEEDVADYRDIMTPWLKKYGYDEEDWQLNESPVIDSAHCTEYFLRLVQEHRAKATKNPGLFSDHPQVKGKINRAEPQVVSGWAIGADMEKPVRVALLVGDAQIGQVEANQMRPGLLKRGVHPTGECGFVFRFKPQDALPVGTQIVVEPVSGEGILRNSPCRICDPDQ